MKDLSLWQNIENNMEYSCCGKDNSIVIRTMGLWRTMIQGPDNE